jgi:hypothetical protein
MNFRELTQLRISDIIDASEAVEDAFPRAQKHDFLAIEESHEQQRLNALLDDLTKTALDELEALMLYGRADTDDTFREILRDTHGPEQRDAQIGYILGKQGSLAEYLRAGLRRLNETAETIGPRSYADLTSEEQNSVLKLYYESEIPVRTIIENYEIDCTPGRLSKQFPPFVLDEDCPFCDIPLVQRRSSRTRSGFNDYEPVCENCGHGKRNPCRCHNCKENREEAARLDRQEKQSLIVLSFAYEELEGPIEPLSMKEAVSLLSFQNIH